MATSPSYTQEPAALFHSAQRGEASRSTEGPSAAEWDQHRELIKSLYEKKPLKDVRAHLEKHHGFRATYVPFIPSRTPPPPFPTNVLQREDVQIQAPQLAMFQELQRLAVPKGHDLTQAA